MLRKRWNISKPSRKPQAKVAPYASLPVLFAEIAAQVSPSRAFAQLPEINDLRAGSNISRLNLICAETLAYFVVLTEFVVRDADTQEEYEILRTKFYNLQRRKLSLEDNEAQRLAIQLRQQHTVQGIRKLQIQLFTAYPVAAGLTDVQAILKSNHDEFVVMPLGLWQPLLPLLNAIYPDQYPRAKSGLVQRRAIEPRTEKEVTDLLRRRLMRFVGRSPQSMANAIRLSLNLFSDARSIYEAQLHNEAQASPAT